ncbi:MAG: XdhC/CoxI family protein [bacterium]|nr:XdhC/CoxI family protein [bacterium]
MSNRNVSLEIHQRIVDAYKASESLWLLTVVASDGSTPAKAGMRELVYRDGNTFGTIGGGAIEKMAIDRVLQEQPSTVSNWSFDLGKISDDSAKTGMICGGALVVMVEPIGAGEHLYIFGGGHCAVALSALAPTVGFCVTVIDNRPEWANRERHPHASQTIVKDYSQVSQLKLAANAFAIVMTHGHTHDETVLRQLLAFPLQFIGVIGSESKVQTMFHRMMESGVARTELERVYSPIGLPTGSHTPQEIAISILAQLLAVRNGMKKIEINPNPLLSPTRLP